MNEKGIKKLDPDSISPSHYKDIVPGYEYMDLMFYILKDFKGIEAHLLGQMYKYMMRLGKKDNDVQELKKVQWYLNYLIQVKQGRNPEKILKTMIITE